MGGLLDHAVEGGVGVDRRGLVGDALEGLEVRPEPPGPLHGAGGEHLRAARGAIGHRVDLGTLAPRSTGVGETRVVQVREIAAHGRRWNGLGEALHAGRLAAGEGGVEAALGYRVPLPAHEVVADVAPVAGDRGVPPGRVGAELAVAARAGGHLERVGDVVVVADVHDAEESILRTVRADSTEALVVAPARVGVVGRACASPGPTPASRKVVVDAGPDCPPPPVPPWA